MKFLKQISLILAFLFLPLSSEGEELFSVQLGSFKTYKSAYNFFNTLPYNVKLFLYRSKNYYTVRAGLFQKKEKAEKEREELRTKFGLNGIVVKTLPKKLLYLFYDEDYEEFLNLFSNINIETLPPSVVYAIGVSYSKIGKVKEAEEVLTVALKKGEKKAIPVLVKLYYAEGNYEKLVSFYESSDKKLPDSVLYYVAIGYLKMGKLEKLKKLINTIKDEKVKDRIFQKRTSAKTSFSYGYDSNIYLVPEDTPLEKRSRNDWYKKFSFSIINSNVFRSYSFSVLGKRFEDRNNSDLDIVVLNFEKETKLSGFNLVFPSASYIYTMNRNYSLTLKSGVRRRFSSIFLSFLLGCERNFINQDRDNLLAEGLISSRGFNIFLLYRNYSDANDKFYITLSKNLKLTISEKINLLVSPKVKVTKYMHSTRSVRPGVSGKLSLKVKGGEAYLRGGYEKNYAHDEGMEWDYKRHFVELGVKYSF
ncbi:SPOR domain-containing protein [Desulfurobacterium crinifex]